ncbi:MAG: histidine triad nucleotide-binding protein [Candidatus Omnitrophica bacterium]|nr:histidine triad nucleotide-binding protein [Candidatus Omnitrophota bacterium]
MKEDRQCIFCKIIAREIGSTILYEDNDIIAFNDIAPKAPVHVIIIPKQHIERINDITAETALLVGRLILVAKTLAEKLEIAESGYRLVFNCNQNAGQAVFHIHLHLLGGRLLHWPPG